MIAVTAISQPKPNAGQNKPATPKTISSKLLDFQRLVASANMMFTFPAGFKETRVLDNDYYSFDYAMEIPGHEFEIWFQVKPQKMDWQNYLASKNDPRKQTADPDTAYLAMGRAQARALSEDTSYLTRNIDKEVLKGYNADAGRSWLLTLPYQRETKHYKYALVLAITKAHTGTFIAVCFTDEKNPEFFKNVNGISRYLKFKP